MPYFWLKPGVDCTRTGEYETLYQRFCIALFRPQHSCGHKLLPRQPMRSDRPGPSARTRQQGMVLLYNQNPKEVMCAISVELKASRRVTRLGVEQMPNVAF